MENRSARKTVDWIEPTASKAIGPGMYNVNDYKAKESFNYGTVPFGSHSNLSILTSSRTIGQGINSQNPGPGYYGASTTTNSTRRGISLESRNLPSLQPGSSFGTSALRKDIGVRDLSTIPGSTRKFKLISPRQSQLSGEKELSHNVSLISLKNKNHVRAAENQSSITHIGLVGSQNTTSQAGLHSLQDPSNTLHIGGMLQDKSITNLAASPFIAESKVSLEVHSTGLLSANRLQPQMSIAKPRRDREVNVSAPVLLSPKKASGDIYAMDLGTMGIPREVARNNYGSDFLFHSEN